MASLTRLWLHTNKLVGSIPAELSVLSALSSAEFLVHTNTHLCGTTAAKAPSATTGTALGSTPCSSQLLQTMALMAFRDGRTAGQAAVSTWSMASGNPVCGGTTWTGVTCSGTNVVAVNRGGQGLAGPLAPEFSALTAMTHLGLGVNGLTGTIPAQLSTMASLSYLALQTNDLTGTIPAQLSTLASLTELKLWNNALTGTIPAQLSTLASLTYLYLQENFLTGTIPAQLSTLASLAVLSLWNNALTGTIPAQMSTLASLASLPLTYNKLVGSIPAEFSVLAALSSANFTVYTNAHLCGTYTKTPSSTSGTALGTAAALSCADITGTALDAACSSQLLQTVALMAFRDRLTAGQAAVSTWNMASGNPVCGGTTSTWTGVTCSGTNVVAVDRFSQGLAGPLAPEFSALTAMTHLALYLNALTGTIPAQLSTMASLTILNLRNNALTGTIPAQLSTMASLTLLQLQTNALTGTIPAQLSTLTSNARLHLHVNALTGTIPAQLSTMASLTGLVLHTNKLVGSIPAELSVLSALSSAWFQVHTNTHLCGTTTAKAPSATTGTALGSTPCSSQLLQTVALMAFRDRLTAGQAAVSTWNMASGN
eukprot:CAMPEP_0182914988 /NCGR_PEP_ID=MMETSP0034_2-20130328/38850_1 /TAXON_ID=156128 /ORGANISM="Nephroselmis pyriformis, Strain CCMP717" /LENGTH=596 /DNA_ID=CAMNT_0025051777 /DNA_START=10 /DNA_END=1798 /DNA_ORIENTATION=-